jgi:hypothetical protein
MARTVLVLATFAHDLADAGHVALFTLLSNRGLDGAIARGGHIRAAMVMVMVAVERLALLDLQLGEPIANRTEATSAEGETDAQ